MKLDQTCPHCGITEAKGAYCTKCYRPTQPEWVHPSAKGRRDGRYSRDGTRRTAA